MILDTNALSAFIDGEPAVGVRLSAESQVAIPVIDSRKQRRFDGLRVAT